MIVQVKLNRSIGWSFISAEEEESIPTFICAEWYGSMVVFKFFIGSKSRILDGCEIGAVLMIRYRFPHSSSSLIPRLSFWR
jgi:hypothetical protein